LDGYCRFALDTELEGSSKSGRKQEEEDQRGHGLKTGQSTPKEEHYFVYPRSNKIKEAHMTTIQHSKHALSSARP
jgi:hypothetical protein